MQLTGAALLLEAASTISAHSRAAPAVAKAGEPQPSMRDGTEASGEGHACSQMKLCSAAHQRLSYGFLSL